MRENTDMHPIKRVIYRYEILSLPSKDGKGIAAVSNDPTVTLTVGASTDDQDKPVKVAVDVEFYDGNGNKFDLTQLQCDCSVELPQPLDRCFICR